MLDIISKLKQLRLHILVAEDNDISMELMTILLGKAGIKVDTVDNGQFVLEKIKIRHYDAIFMDVQMPGLDGFDTTRLIRKWEVGTEQHIPIIATTAQSLKGDREQCLAAGMDDYISKPIKPTVLFDTIEHWVSHRHHPEIKTTDSTLRDAFVKITSDSTLEGLVLEEAPTLESNEPRNANIPMLTTEKEPPINQETALPLFFNNRQLFLEMCQQLIIQIPDMMFEINQALHTNHTKDLKRHAHNLKGVMANFSAGPVSQAADKIASMNSNTDPELAAQWVQQLESEIENLYLYLENQLGLKRTIQHPD